MKKQPRDRSTAIYIIPPAELRAELDATCKANGTSISDEVILAIRRHLAYPPRREIPPLPDSKPPESSGKQGRKKV